MKAPLFLLVSALALGSTVCGGGTPQPGRAEELFESEGCAVCHGAGGSGAPGTGPALRDLAPYWSEARLLDYLGNPPGFRERNPDFEDRRDAGYELEMPAFDHLSEDDLRLLARWLLTR